MICLTFECSSLNQSSDGASVPQAASQGAELTFFRCEFDLGCPTEMVLNSGDEIWSWKAVIATLLWRPSVQHGLGRHLIITILMIKEILIAMIMAHHLRRGPWWAR